MLLRFLCLQQLKHDNIVSLIEVFRRKGKLYLVFEYVERTVMEDLERNPNGLSPGTIKRIMWQLLRAVDFCHSHNVVHRDIKPENLLMSQVRGILDTISGICSRNRRYVPKKYLCFMVMQHGTLKLCDFGFARTLAGPGAKYTDYVSTRWYRSPELLVGDTAYGKAVDMWAIGCFMAEISNGLPLFPGDSDVDQLFHIMQCFGNLTPRMEELVRKNPEFAGTKLPRITERETLERKLPHLDAAALDLIQRCLTYEPLQRASCAELLRHEYFAGFEDEFAPVRFVDKFPPCVTSLS